MASGDKEVRSKDPIERGVKETETAGIATFVGGRLADVFVQYGILANGLGSSLITTFGGSVLPQGPPLKTDFPLVGLLGLSPYRSILLGMSVTSMLKQNIHIIFIMQERMKPGPAAGVGLFNMLVNSINDVLFVCAQTSASANGQLFPQTPLIIGSLLFAAGIGLELGSEVQRHAFKKDPANKGKVYQGGLFSLSRHINYFGYTLWRTGYALASGGYIWGAITAAFFTAAFTQSSIPGLQDYLEQRYGVQYQQYKKAVPYQFVPYVY